MMMVMIIKIIYNNILLLLLLIIVHTNTKRIALSTPQILCYYIRQHKNIHEVKV